MIDYDIVQEFDGEYWLRVSKDDMAKLDAAPEFLAALELAAHCLAWHEERHGVGMDRKAVEDARAAIAKARGE